MTRPLLLFIIALATATIILLGAGAMPATAQPGSDSAPSADAKPKRYPEAQEALDLLAKRDMPGAIKKLEEAARKYPELPSVHVLMYEILAQLNQSADARAELDKAVKANPSDPEPYLILGEIALQERRVTEATLDFDKAKQLLATYANAKRKAVIEQQVLSGIAQLAETGEDWKVAEAVLRDLLKLAPEDLAAHRRLARSLFRQGKAREAYEILKKAKQIDRENAKKHGTREVFPDPEDIITHNFAIVEGPKAATGNCEESFRTALKNAPNDLPTRLAAAVWGLENGKLDFAKEQAEAAVKIEAADASLPLEKRRYDGSTVGRVLRGNVASWQKDWAEAEHYFEKVILDSPNDFVARNNMALALCEQDDAVKKQRALDYALGNYNANKNNPDALSTLGWVYFRLGKFDQARLAIEGAVKATNGNISNADTATYLAYILYHIGQKYQAKEILESVLKSKKSFSMRPEAQQLYEKVRDAKLPEAAPAEKGP